jgi:ATP-binding cassette subfamily B protein
LIGIACVTCSNFFKARVPAEIGKALDFVLTEVELFKGQDGTDEMFVEKLGSHLMQFGITVLVFALIMGVFMYFMRQTIIYNSRLIEYDLRKDIYDQYQKMDISFFKKHNTGDLMSRISEDVTKVRMYLGPALLYGINLVSLFAMVIYAMVTTNPTLSLYTLLPLPFLSISIYLVSSVINKKSEAIQEQLATLTSFAQESFSGIQIIKSYVKEKSFGSAFTHESELFKEKSLELAKVNAMFFPLMILLISASTLLTVLMGGIQVIKGQATAGEIAQFIIYVNMLTWPVTAIGWIASIIQTAEASQKRINEFLNEKTKIASPQHPIDYLSGDIAFQNVSFTYPNSGIKALNNISFTLKEGEKMIVIGKTASGKSTVADLMLRLYDPENGTISIGGQDIKELDLNHLRHAIGYVPQDVFLFSDSVSNNIRFADHSSDEQKVYEFAEHASVRKDILNLPEQFETNVGERGVSLSGGQKQRISIARALIKDPQIVILDDCLSAVDTATEQHILSYFKAALKDKSAILITHRIFTSLDVDKVLVLEDGQILEFGTPQELMKTKGFYHQMVTDELEENQVKTS